MDAATKYDAQRIPALLCEIRDAALDRRTTPADRQLISSCCRALHIQETLFRPAWNNFSAEWRPTKSELEVIDDACCDFYWADNLQGTFYRYGGLYGLIALVTVIRGSDSIYTEMGDIKGTPGEEWLVWNVSEIYRSIGNNWAKSWKKDFEPRTATQDLPLKGLGRHSGRQMTELKIRKMPEKKYVFPKLEDLGSFGHPRSELDKPPGERTRPLERPLENPPKKRRKLESALIYNPEVFSCLYTLSPSFNSEQHSSAQLPPTPPRSTCDSFTVPQLLLSQTSPAGAQQGRQIERHAQRDTQVHSPEITSNESVDTLSLENGRTSQCHVSISPDRYIRNTDSLAPPHNSRSATIEFMTSQHSGHSCDYPNGRVLERRRTNTECSTSGGLAVPSPLASLLRHDDGNQSSQVLASTSSPLPRPTSESSDQPAFFAEQNAREKATLTAALGNMSQIDALNHLRSRAEWIHEFLRFLCALNPDAIHEAIFIRALSPQNRWGDTGYVERITLSHIGLGIQALSSLSSYNEAIRELLFLGLITEANLPDQLKARTFQIAPQIRLHIDPGSLSYKHYAWKFITFVYPCVEELEQLYGNYCRLLLPQLEYILGYQSELTKLPGYDPHSGHRLAGALIASSKVHYSDDSWKYRAIKIAEELLQERPCSRMRIEATNIQEPSIHRVNEDIFLGRELVRQKRFLHNNSIAETPIAAENPKANTHRGRMILSATVRLVENGDLKGALALLNSFTPFDELLNSHSPAESLVQVQIDLWKAKIPLFQGDFLQSQKLCSELLERSPRMYDRIGTSILTTFIQVKCELGFLDQAMSVAAETLDYFARCELTNVKKGRDIQCSKADVLLCSGRYREAHEIYQRLYDIYQRLYDMSAPITRVTCFHYLAGIAMSLHHEGDLEAARKCWDEVTDKLRQWGWEAGFSEMVSSYAISDLSFRAGQIESGEKYLTKGNELFRKIGRQHWITALGSRFLDFLKDSISSQTSSRIDIR